MDGCNHNQPSSSGALTLLAGGGQGRRAIMRPACPVMAKGGRAFASPGQTARAGASGRAQSCPAPAPAPAEDMIARTATCSDPFLGRDGTPAA